MQYSEIVQVYLQFIEVERNLSPETLRSYRSLLNRYSAWVGDVSVHDALTLTNLRSYQYHEFKRGQRPRSIRSAIMSFRGFCAWLVDEKILESNPTERLTVPKKDAAVRRVVSDGEVDALFGAVERIADKRRRAMYRALLSTLVFAGLRATEACDLKLQDVLPDAGMLIVTSGKGRKRRELYPSPEFFEAYAAWLTERDKMGCKHDSVFAHAVHKRVAYEGLRKIVIEITTAAGFEGQNITAHCLRHNFATYLHRAGATVLQVQAALGHADAQTTLRYLHLHKGDTQAMALLASRRTAPSLSTPQPKVAVAPKNEVTHWETTSQDERTAPERTVIRIGRRIVRPKPR